MEEEMEEEKRSKGDAIFLFVGLALLIIIILLIICNYPALQVQKKATLSDIDGNWTTETTKQTYTFIPKSNIDGLEFKFTLLDKNKQTVQTITKKVGNVIKGQQYTVTLSIYEIESISSFLNISYVQTEISNGTKK